MRRLDDVSPDLHALAVAYPQMVLDTATLPALRAEVNRSIDAIPAPRIAHIESSDGARIEVRVHGLGRRSAEPCPALLHLHGGGYVLGNAAMMDRVNARRARALRCVVVSVDYRLAPEFPYPAPLADCYAALRWLASQADRFGVDRQRIAVVGESAGAGLAAALALYARDRGGPPIAHQHLLYPMLDDRTAVRSAPETLGQFVWNNEQNRFAWGAFLGAMPGGEAVSPYAAPARADSLANLPPAYIAVGALDLFLGECLDYVRRLAEQGTPVEARIYPGLFHAAEVFAPSVEISRRFSRDSRRAMHRMLSL